jgi:molybdopterin synthase catalytic subunit
MIRIQAEDFDVGLEIDGRRASERDTGAIVSFTGLVRSDGGLIALELEHYPAMAQKALEAIEAEARARWPIGDCLIIHRYGRLQPGDRIVLVVTASAHREAAFAAASFLMDYLKTRAPFWKREIRADGTHWVEARAYDDEAAARWESTD